LTYKEKRGGLVYWNLKGVLEELDGLKTRKARLESGGSLGG